MTSSPVDRAAHWQNVYLTKPDQETSWYQSEPATSLRLIREVSIPGRRIIDVGGGSSSLGGMLAADGFHVTVIDISSAAIQRAKARTGAIADQINWIAADITQLDQLESCDVWHDRAVFHFLIDPADRRRYVNLARRTIAPGGHLVIATFALDGPEKCSGLPVERYDAARLHAEFGDDFELIRCFNEPHATPWGKQQSFFFAVLRRTGA